MANDDATARQGPSPGIVWFARIMSWLCWAGIAGSVVFGIMGTFDLFPADWVVSESDAAALISSSVEVIDPAAPNGTAELQQDLLYRLSNLVAIGLFVWALFSASRIFVGIGRGQYFARGTILGLRNFALAVLLHMTLAPALKAAASWFYVSRFEHGSYSLVFSLSGGVLLMLIFAGAVALISAVMAHAAKIEDENRQFV